MRWSWIAPLLVSIGLVFSLPPELQRRQDSIALSVLQCVALIQDYNLQGWCAIWIIIGLDTYSSRLPSSFQLLCRRDLSAIEKGSLRRREVPVPAILAVYPPDIITKACDQVEGVLTPK